MQRAIVGYYIVVLHISDPFTHGCKQTDLNRSLKGFGAEFWYINHVH